ncbi:hypothetical protein [Synechococcus sp. CS-205]|nr:hypothetical protein [Synechococcus sp. CS-205]
MTDLTELGADLGFGVLLAGGHALLLAGGGEQAQQAGSGEP